MKRAGATENAANNIMKSAPAFPIAAYRLVAAGVYDAQAFSGNILTVCGAVKFNVPSKRNGGEARGVKWKLSRERGRCESDSARS